MDATLFELLLPAAVLLLVWLIVSSRVPPSFWRNSRELLDRLGNELRHSHDRSVRRPVFSAETIRGRESELRRLRLARKTPRAGFGLALGALLVAGVLVWWLTR
jgi:hypothetical protein